MNSILIEILVFIRKHTFKLMICSTLYLVLYGYILANYIKKEVPVKILVVLSIFGYFIGVITYFINKKVFKEKTKTRHYKFALYVVIYVVAFFSLSIYSLLVKTLDSSWCYFPFIVPGLVFIPNLYYSENL